MSNGQEGGPGGRLIRLVWRKPADTLAERTRRRVTIYLIPFLFCLYILAYLDRVNISVAQLAMEEAAEPGRAGIRPADDRPRRGNLLLGLLDPRNPQHGERRATGGPLGVRAHPHSLGHLRRARRDDRHAVRPPALCVAARDQQRLGRPGLLAGVVRFVNGLRDDPKYQLYFFRFMLGFFEGGFFPSVIVYLSHWFRSEDRAKAIASFMAAIPLSLVLGVPISGMLLGVHWFGLPGWRWIFLLEGIAPVIAGFVTLFYLPDLPSKAKWLPAEERDWLAAELEREHKLKSGLGHAAWVRHLGAVLLLTGVYFCSNLTSYGLTMFMPAIIKSQSGVSSQAASFLAALPYFVGMVVMLVNGWHSDRTGERPWHAAVPLALVSAGIWLTAMVRRRAAPSSDHHHFRCRRIPFRPFARVLADADHVPRCDGSGVRHRIH